MERNPAAAPKPLTLAQRAEILVARLMQEHGWSIRARNFRHIGCELDLVAQKGAQLAIIEVKYRRYFQHDAAFIQGLLPARKQEALRRGAAAYLSLHAVEESWAHLRFDLAVLTPQVWSSLKKNPQAKGLPGGFYYFSSVF